MYCSMYAGGPATADIGIIGGDEVNIGDKVVIQCSYTGGPALSYPYFTINGDDIEPHNLEIELSNYEHNYHITFTSSGCAATYNLTLSNVSVEYNGTTYQCYIKLSNKEEKSTTVTLIVRGGQHFSHSMGTFCSKVANIKTMHVALCIQKRGQQDRRRHTSLNIVYYLA